MAVFMIYFPPLDLQIIAIYLDYFCGSFLLFIMLFPKIKYGIFIFILPEQ